MAWSWFLILLGIGFLIFVHELGHFLVAKYEKVNVEAFALGFGFPLFKKEWNGTEYRINLIPLGGYVKMAGELPGEEVTGSPDEFLSKTPGQRSRILIAGVFMNFVFGILGAIIAFQLGVRFISPTVGSVVPGSGAWHAGIQKGDKIIEMDGEKISRFRQIRLGVAFGNEKKGIKVKVERDGKVIEKIVVPSFNSERGMLLIGVSPFYNKLKVKENTSLYKAGLRTGDEVIKIDNKSIASAYDLIAFSSNKKTADVIVKRNGKNLSQKIELVEEERHLLGLQARFFQIQSIRKNSKVAELGFKEKDIILSLNNKKLTSIKELKTLLEQLKSKKNEIIVERAGKEVSIQVQYPYTFLDDIAFNADLYVGNLFASAKKYLKTGDKLLKIGKQKLTSWTQIQSIVRESKGKKLTIVCLRDGKEVEVAFAPQKIKKFTLGNFGILPKMSKAQKLGIGDSFKYGVRDAKQMIMEIFLTLKGLFSRKISTKNLGGPVMIFTASYDRLQMGAAYFIYFLALISINLAVINLLPIPVLDGGHIALLLVEKIRGKAVSEKVMTWVNYAGLFFLLALIIYVTGNDILRLFRLF